MPPTFRLPTARWLTDPLSKRITYQHLQERPASLASEFLLQMGVDWDNAKRLGFQVLMSLRVIRLEPSALKPRVAASTLKTGVPHPRASAGPIVPRNQ
jgi:hypothetical protein